MALPLRSRLKNGEILLGTMATLPCIPSAEILSSIGFDWLFVDAEHGPFSNDSLLALLSAIGERTPTLVRTGGPDEVAIKQVLDMGATGIIAPQVNSSEQAADVVRFARYSPEGARGVGLGRAQGYGTQFQEYLQRAKSDTTVVVQAEHRDAVECIEKTVQIEGIDAILIGPYDLSASYGKMGQLDAPEVVSAIQHVTNVCLNAKMPLGIFGLRPEAVAPYIEQGFQLIVAGVDTLLLAESAKQLHQDLRELTN